MTQSAAIARDLRVAATRDHALGTVTIFTDAQAAIWRMTSDDPGPDQKCPIMAGKHIAALYTKEPGVCIFRWYPSHQCIEGNEITDEWAKQAAGEPDAHGVEWLDFKDRGPSLTSSVTSQNDVWRPETRSAESSPKPGVSTGRPGRLHLRPGRAWLIQASEISAGKAQAF